ncbi:MAG: lytic transglycosylase domain-containing protein [Sphingomonadales bacterium]|jgi:hypothetical protein|nr:lytic transglycosylase domain-containing protein [Sphingomonadales bacterium]MBK9004790.1 lytic transglycosylase domain-containing protein [Sphingomonadales bacterium]MBK9267483.1 lytic transglycosylase domain-containing protein [Sphingomonadales bacterium]MBP6433232.1 lytic transglycosylase domain-containing protein [Sphingorhabdus sp.]
MSQTSALSNPPAISGTLWRAINDAANRTGVDFGFLLDQARIESGLRPDAKAATSSATGLYQFTTQTWLATLDSHGAEHGFGWAADAIVPTGRGQYRVAEPALREAILELRRDPAAAALMAGELAADNRAHLAGALGRPVEPVDLYLAHFLGASGAESFLKAWAANPDDPAAPLLPKAAAANRPIFFDSEGAPRSLDAIRRRFAEKLGGEGALSPLTPNRAWHETANAAPPTGAAMELRPIEAMPKGLSLDFAHDAYRKLAMMQAARA